MQKFSEFNESVAKELSKKVAKEVTKAVNGDVAFYFKPSKKELRTLMTDKGFKTLTVDGKTVYYGPADPVDGKKVWKYFFKGNV